MDYAGCKLGFVPTDEQVRKIESVHLITGRSIKDCVMALESEEWDVEDAVIDLRNDSGKPLTIAKTHTVPNSITVQIVLAAGQHPQHMAVVRRNGQTLAMYPAVWTRNRIPTMREVQREFRWNLA